MTKEEAIELRNRLGKKVFISKPTRSKRRYMEESSLAMATLKKIRNQK